MLGTLNLGILAHVDAGKTTLTERLLYAAGVIDEPGSVDAGTTQTDSLALERQRGITIKSAVVSFRIGGMTVNLIDTPGHPDFIAEVERALSVLDGVVLVISAVEGVQPQTRILWRALRRLRVPTLIFVNKIDRRGAGYERVLGDIAARLTPAIVAMGTVSGLGTLGAAFIPGRAASGRATPGPGTPGQGSRAARDLAEVLAEHDDAVLAAYLDNGTALPDRWLREKLAAQVKAALVHPVYFGSAGTGAGVDELAHGLASLLPAARPGTEDGPVRGRVFKVERGAAGEKIAYARVFSGTVAVRDRIRFGHGGDGKVTAISVFADGGAVRGDRVSAGHIAMLSGLARIQVGDAIGVAADGAGQRYFAPPTLETAVVARDPRGKARLRAALAQLAEQDPLINVRQDDLRQEIYLSLYGEVQKQVIEATLATEYGLEAGFRETVPICVERPVRTGTAEEVLHAPDNPFLATLGIRVDPAPAGSGIGFRLDVGHQAVPLYIYKNVDAFAAAMREYVTGTLRQGLRGWQVTDCVVTLVRSQYSIADGPPSTRGPLSSAQDFRKLMPLVVMAALRRAGTVVCEPVHRFVLDAPTGTLNVLLPVLAKLRAVPEVTATEDGWCTLEGDIPVARLHELRQQIPQLTGGEGVLEAVFDHYAPIRGQAPVRPRTDDNPLNREEYLRRVTRRGLPVAGRLAGVTRSTRPRSRGTLVGVSTPSARETGSSGILGSKLETPVTFHGSDPDTVAASAICEQTPTKCQARTRLYRDGTLEREGFPVSEISDHLADERVTIWLDLRGPDREDLVVLSQEFGLHPLAIEDAVYERERPKLDRYRTHLFLTAYGARLNIDTGELATSEVAAFVTPRALITVRKDDGLDIGALTEHWDASPDLAVFGVGYLLYGLLDYIVDGHFETVQTLDDQVELLEDRLFADVPGDLHIQRHSFQLRKSLVLLRRVVIPMREVTNTLMRRDLHAIHDDLMPYYQDVYDHVLRAAEWTESLRDLVNSILETNLTIQGNRMNVITKKVTSWAAIVAVPTFITGFYGMNVPYPGFSREIGFTISVVLMVLAGAALYLAFKRRDWL